jgi:hypothetical protein
MTPLTSYLTVLFGLIYCNFSGLYPCIYGG